MWQIMQINYGDVKNTSRGIQQFISLKMPHPECVQDAANDEDQPQR